MPPAPNNSLNWADLIPAIEKIARQVGLRTNASSRVRDELETLALSFVYEKSGHYNPAAGKFEAWCQTLLSNKCVDLIRKDATGRRIVAAAGEMLSEKLRDSQRPVDEIEAPDVDWFSLYEEHLRPIDRILMVLDLEQVSRCPPATTVSWIRQAKLPHEFPMNEFEAMPKRDRNRAVARALLQAGGCELTDNAVTEKMNWIRTRVSRAKTTLRKCIKDFGGE